MIYKVQSTNKEFGAPMDEVMKEPKDPEKLIAMTTRVEEAMAQVIKRGRLSFFR